MFSKRFESGKLALNTCNIFRHSGHHNRERCGRGVPAFFYAMAFDISIQHDLKKLKRQLNALETQAMPQATIRTLNRVAESAKVASARHIAPQMNSRQAAVKRRIETRKASFKRLWATLIASDRALQLIEFVVGGKKPTQQKGGKRGPVKAKVYGKTRTLSKAFIAPRKSGSSKTTVYMRKSPKRKPLKLLYGPGIMQLFRQRENDQIMQTTVRERFPIEFARNLAFYVERIRRR